MITIFHILELLWSTTSFPNMKLELAPQDKGSMYVNQKKACHIQCTLRQRPSLFATGHLPAIVPPSNLPLLQRACTAASPPPSFIVTLSDSVWISIPIPIPIPILFIYLLFDSKLIKILRMDKNSVLITFNQYMKKKKCIEVAHL